MKEKLTISNSELLKTNENQQQLIQDLEQLIVTRTKDADEAKLIAELQKDRFYKFLMEAPVGIVILDGPTLIYELVNPTYQKLFPEKEFLNKSLFEVFPEIIGTPIASILENVYKTGETFEAKEFLIPIHKNLDAPLEDTYWNIIYQPRRNEHNKIDGALAFAIDVSDNVIARKKVEDSANQIDKISEQLAVSYVELENVNAELLTANEEIQAGNEELQTSSEEIHASNEELRLTIEKLNQINSDLDNFIYTASHDLKAPIKNIEGLIIALKVELSDQNVGGEIIIQLIEFIESSIQRFNHTIEDLTNVAKVQKDNDSSKTKLSINEVIEEVLLDLDFMVKETKANVSFDSNFPIIYFSKKNLRSILYNLISNAIKYKHPDRKPELEISWINTENYLLLSFSDNGIGMNLKAENKLFKMFGRLHQHVEGSGVGLHMVKKILENSGGKIEVESEINIGSIFRIFIPINVIT